MSLETTTPLLFLRYRLFEKVCLLATRNRQGSLSRLPHVQTTSHSLCRRTSYRIKEAQVAKTGKRIAAYPDDQGSITRLIEMLNAVLHNLAWVLQKQEPASDTWSMKCRHPRSHWLWKIGSRFEILLWLHLLFVGFSVLHPYPVKPFHVGRRDKSALKRLPFWR